MRLGIFLLGALIVLPCSAVAAGPDRAPGYQDSLEQPQVIVRPSRAGKV